MDFKEAVRKEVLYNILDEFCIPVKLVRLIKMCLNETYSGVRVDRYLSDMSPIRDGLKQGDTSILSPLLFNFALVCAVRGVQIIQDGLKLNGTPQRLVYADDVNISGGSVHAVKENTGAFVVASKENGIEVNTDKSKYMFMSRDQNSGRSHNIKTDNSFLKGWKSSNTSIWEQP